MLNKREPPRARRYFLSDVIFKFSSPSTPAKNKQQKTQTKKQTQKHETTNKNKGVDLIRCTRLRWALALSMWLPPCSSRMCACPPNKTNTKHKTKKQKTTHTQKQNKHNNKRKNTNRKNTQNKQNNKNTSNNHTTNKQQKSNIKAKSKQKLKPKHVFLSVCVCVVICFCYVSPSNRIGSAKIQKVGWSKPDLEGSSGFLFFGFLSIWWVKLI